MTRPPPPPRPAPTPPRPASTRWLLDLLSLGAIAAAGAALLGWWNPIPSLQPEPLPAVNAVRNGDGLVRADIDHASLQQSCAKAGIPPPPDLRGIDVVPVQRLVQAMSDWQAEREGPALGRMGQIYLALGLDRSALECFAAASSFDPESTLWPYMAGVCCQSLGENDAARALLERSRERDPAYAATTGRLATLALEAGDLDSAAKQFEEFVRRQSNSPLGYNGMGQVALARGQAAQAEQWFERAVAAKPDDFRAWRLYGRALALNGKVERSREAFARGNALTQYDGWAPFDPRLGQAHDVASTQTSLEGEVQRAGRNADPAKAIAALEALRARRPHDIATVGNLALVYHHAGRPETALMLARDAVTRSPNSALAYECLADITFLQQRFDDSLAATEAIIRIDPRRVRGHELRGRVLYAVGKRDEGLASVSRALELDSRRDDLRILLATLLDQAGRGIEAEPLLVEVLSRDAKNYEVRAILERIRAQRTKPSFGPG